MITLDMISKGILATTMVSFTVLGDLVFMCKGLPIGGVMSMVAGTAILAAQVFVFNQEQEARIAAGFYFDERAKGNNVLVPFQ